MQEDQIIGKKSYSKSFDEGLAILMEEIEMALQWNRPSILLAVMKSKVRSAEAQQSLARKIINKNKRVSFIEVGSENPDVIKIISESLDTKDVVFFVSGIEKADRESGGKVFRALNIRRELLVERQICVVFWLNEAEASDLTRFAPDFWAFRHRVIEFAPKHGTPKQFVPAGLFLWEKQIPWMDADAITNKITYYDEFLARLPKEDESATSKIETILKLVHYNWLLNDLNKVTLYLKHGFELLGRFPIPQYYAWILNAKGITLYEEGNKKDASLHFASALSHNPNNCMIMMNTSLSAYGLGRNSIASQTGRRSVKKDPASFHLWRVLGYLFLSMGKYKDAITAMISAREINPNDIDIYYSLALCYHKNEQSEECKKELSIAEKFSAPRSAIQDACLNILNHKTDQALEQLQYSIKHGAIGKHHISRDVNLHFLLDVQEYLISN